MIDGHIALERLNGEIEKTFDMEIISENMK